MLCAILVHEVLRMLMMVMLLFVLVMAVHELLVMVEIWHAHQALAVRGLASSSVVLVPEDGLNVVLLLLEVGPTVLKLLQLLLLGLQHMLLVNL